MAEAGEQSTEPDAGIPAAARRERLTRGNWLTDPMRVLIAPDKFKGSLTAGEAAAQIAAGWLDAWPGCEIALQPIADGGDGTLEFLAASLGGEWRRTQARNARGRPVDVPWLWQPRSAAAWIESARICGLAALEACAMDPWTATTAGIGDAIMAAAAQGAAKAYICLGGSATNDGGCGMAAALGYIFRDREGRAFDPLPCRLAGLDRIERPVHLPDIEIIGLTDVLNPLLGTQGATRVYGPQKGAMPATVEKLEEAMAHLVQIAGRDLDAPDTEMPGAGAAGGLGFGIATFLQGKLLPGFETIANLTGLHEAIQAADLVITGEGRIDGQTTQGKAPAGVARLAKLAGKPVIALAGSVPLSNTEGFGFDALYSITDGSLTTEQAMARAASLLRSAAARAAQEVRHTKLL